jgi:hypothetical protein
VRSRRRSLDDEALKPDKFTAQEFDGMALAHGARALTAAEKRNLPSVAGKRAH